MGAMAAMLDCLRFEQLGNMQCAGLGCKRNPTRAMGNLSQVLDAGFLTPPLGLCIGERGVVRRWLLSTYRSSSPGRRLFRVRLFL